jgi:hypothetical protein
MGICSGRSDTESTIRPPEVFERICGRLERVAIDDVSNTSNLALEYEMARHFFMGGLEGLDNSTVVLIDATALPKSVLSFVVGALVRSRSVRGVDILYRRAQYLFKGTKLEIIYNDKERSREINDIEFELAPVPYVEGKYNASKRRHVILLAGMDYHRAFWKVHELEPAVIDVILDPSSSMPPMSSAVVLETLVRELDYDIASCICTDRTDLVEVHNALMRLTSPSRSEIGRLQPVLIASGWKPHLLAATLFSIASSEAPLLTTIPDRVVPLQVIWQSGYSLYRIRDRTAVI